MHSSQKTTILLARHGECSGNIEGRFRGRVDFPLNETGIRQAAELGEAMLAFHPEAVVTSPLLRAKATAVAIASRCSARLIEEEGFTNTSLGIWEGRLKTEIERDSPEKWKTWIEDPEKLAVEGAESMGDVLGRSMDALEKYAERFRGKTFAVVTHRTVIKPLLAACLGIASPYFWKVHMDTAAYSVLFHDDIHGYSLYSLNITGHLSGFTTEWV
ncbi:histidine phosphatase family protein [Aminivibrio sp.]|jgi:broad specificity phosphatase PhoE|uniref:histidine phosphatase family protein n=1 Tax=Aminivibrio sp. TaxID=1872489 RepID=UPI00169A3B50|nr:histidine phosphatase family protein [Synergistaceae bacterium]MDD4612073.1 histidine phosphatase family protein [Synergistaceae bacterium]NCC56210.1 histidine phosphatase family protein [Synergistales bacterium]NLO59349.1 histidine phosphatase family protein [Synergistaceae bacterium]